MMKDRLGPTAALADVARIGPFFALDTDPDIAGHPLWRPFTELAGRALPDQIAAVLARLGVGERRVAASLLFQGIAGRLWSPVLATAVEHDVVPDLDPARTYWRAASPGPVLLAAP
ncbi:ferric iron reductase, partial [Actinoallomurus acaciae]